MRDRRRALQLVPVVLIMLVCLQFSAFATDWPQYLGPERDGTSPETGLARSWPPDGPPKQWSVDLGEGFVGAAVRDSEVYILDREPGTRDILRVFSLETGEELWRYAYDAPGDAGQNGSRAVPNVTEKYVYSVGMMGDLYCIDRTTHEPIWHRKLPETFTLDRSLEWGYSQSPSVYQNLVVVAPQAEFGFVAAFNRFTGDVVWESEGFGTPGYSSPRIVNLAGADQVVMVSAGEGGVSGFSVEDGSTLWNYDGWECRIPIPFATPLPDDRLFITGEYGAGSAMIRIEKNGQEFNVDELFTTNDCGSQIHQPILYQDHLYMNSNGNKRQDGMLCLSLDGKVKWRTKDDRDLPRFGRGSLILVGDLILNFDGRVGNLHLVEPNPNEYRELARVKLFDGARMWAPLAFSEGRLLVRSQEELVCLDLRDS